MKNVFKKIDAVKTGIFAAGVLFGTAGIKGDDHIGVSVTDAANMVVSDKGETLSPK